MADTGPMYHTGTTRQLETPLVRLERQLHESQEYQLKLEASIRFLKANPDAIALLEMVR